MIGYHAVSVLADMIVKGVKGFDYERAYEAMKRTAMNPNYDCLPEYTANGYVPFDKEAESVSKTLEYAYDDYCIAQAAKVLGKEDDYEYFMNRSMGYQTLIDPETKYMRGRDSKGNWREPFAPIAYQGPGSVNGWGDITEGFTMQYTWTVPHDVQGYINECGAKLFEKRLDELFVLELPDDIPGAHDIQGRIGGYWHGNEPCHHVAYLYNYLGKPWKCQERIREIAAKFYGNTPGALSGNDDCGQMSAWYMFNCLGFYPVAPSSNQYNIGSPCVKAITLTMSNGKKIEVTTENWSEDNVYIKEMYLNGKKYPNSYLNYEDIKDGVKIHYVMSNKPNYKRAISMKERPSSVSKMVKPGSMLLTNNILTLKFMSMKKETFNSEKLMSCLTQSDLVGKMSSMALVCSGLFAAPLFSSSLGTVHANVGIETVMQSVKVKGTVLDKNQTPIIGATVMVEGTSTGTITDLDGNYFIEVPNKTANWLFLILDIQHKV